MRLNPAFMKYVEMKCGWEKKGKYPSSGFLTLTLIMHVCDEVGSHYTFCQQFHAIPLTASGSRPNTPRNVDAPAKGKEEED